MADITRFDGVWRATYLLPADTIIPLYTIWIVVREGQFGGVMNGGGAVYGRIDDASTKSLPYQVSISATATLEYAPDDVVLVTSTGQQTEPAQYKGLLTADRLCSILTGEVTLVTGKKDELRLKLQLLKKNEFNE